MTGPSPIGWLPEVESDWSMAEAVASGRSVISSNAFSPPGPASPEATSANTSEIACLSDSGSLALR